MMGWRRLEETTGIKSMIYGRREGLEHTQFVKFILLESVVFVMHGQFYFKRKKFFRTLL